MISDDYRDSFSTISSSHEAKSIDEFMYLVRMVEYTDSLLCMGIGSTLEEIAANTALQNLSKDAFMAKIESISSTEATSLAAALKRYHAKKCSKREQIK